MKYVTLPRLIRQMADEDPKRVFLRTCTGEVFDYQSSHEVSLRWAALYESIGVGAGEPVCHLLPTTPEAIHSWLGLAWLGAIEVPINTAYKGKMLTHTIQDSGATVLTVSKRYIDNVKAAAPSLENVTTIVVPDAKRGELPELQDFGFKTIFGEDLPTRTSPEQIHEPQPWDTASILYTSGTTGPSKGVIVSWAQLEATAQVAIPFEPRDVFYSPLPLYHVTAKIVGVYLPALAGGEAVLKEQFKTGEFWPDIHKYQCTATALVGSIGNFVAGQPSVEGEDVNPLQRVAMVPIIAGVEEFKKRFGVSVSTVFNMTETSNPIISDGFNLVNERSCGRPRPGYHVRLVDENDVEVPRGQVGELIVRSDEPWTLMGGYWRNPEATVKAWRNQWFHTGDAFIRDEDDNFYFVDRFKDTIRRRGENISSFEVEAEVDEFPPVLESAAVAVPSEWGEDEVKVFVVPKAGETIDPAQLHEYLKQTMPAYMIPRYIEVRSELPKTPTLKVRKAQLRAESSSASVWDAQSPNIQFHNTKR